MQREFGDLSFLYHKMKCDYKSYFASDHFEDRILPIIRQQEKQNVAQLRSQYKILLRYKSTCEHEF